MSGYKFWYESRHGIGLGMNPDLGWTCPTSFKRNKTSFKFCMLLFTVGFFCTLDADVAVIFVDLFIVSITVDLAFVFVGFDKFRIMKFIFHF